MSAKDRFDAATDELRQHELEHVLVQRRYNASNAKLEILTRAANDAWHAMVAELEQGISK